MKIKSIIKIILIPIIVFSILGFNLRIHETIGKVNFILGTSGDVCVSHPGEKHWSNAKLFSSEEFLITG